MKMLVKSLCLILISNFAFAFTLFVRLFRLKHEIALSCTVYN